MRHRQQSLQQQQHQDDGQGHGGQHGVSNGNFQQPRLTASALARMQQFQQQQNHSVVEPSSNITSSSTTRSLYDVKAMQKEAVLSYVKVTNEAFIIRKKAYSQMNHVYFLRLKNLRFLFKMKNKLIF